MAVEFYEETVPVAEIYDGGITVKAETHADVEGILFARVEFSGEWVDGTATIILGRTTEYDEAADKDVEIDYRPRLGEIVQAFVAIVKTAGADPRGEL